MNYLATLSGPRLALWCYLIWYAVIAVRYFDPDPWLWSTSLGLSLIVGAGLNLNAISGSASGKLEPWQSFRFFLVPFCVSSFSALVKGRGFILVFSTNPSDVCIQVALVLVFCAAVFFARKFTVPRTD